MKIMTITPEQFLQGKKKCCICGKEFWGYGNNPSPVKERGRCCDECNLNVVVPARIYGLPSKNGGKR